MTNGQPDFGRSYIDKIYIFAGYDGNNRVNDFWQYDTEHEAGKWKLGMEDPLLGPPPKLSKTWVLVPKNQVFWDNIMFYLWWYQG